MRRITNLARLGSLFTLFLIVLAACGGSSSTGTGSSTSSSTTAKTAALVTDIGGLNDQGFNQLSYAGYKKAEAEFGFKERVIQTQSQNDYVQNLTSAAQAAD